MNNQYTLIIVIILTVVELATHGCISSAGKKLLIVPVEKKVNYTDYSY